MSGSKVCHDALSARIQSGSDDGELMGLIQLIWRSFTKSFRELHVEHEGRVVGLPNSPDVRVGQRLHP